MSRVFKYVQDAADLAEPYVRNAGEYVANTVQYAGDCVRKKKKAIHRRNFFARLNGIIQFSTNVVLMVAAVIALIIAVSEYFNRKDV